MDIALGIGKEALFPSSSTAGLAIEEFALFCTSRLSIGILILKSGDLPCTLNAASSWMIIGAGSSFLISLADASAAAAGVGMGIIVRPVEGMKGDAGNGALPLWFCIGRRSTSPIGRRASSGPFCEFADVTAAPLIMAGAFGITTGGRFVGTAVGFVSLSLIVGSSGLRLDHPAAARSGFGGFAGACGTGIAAPPTADADTDMAAAGADAVVTTKGLGGTVEGAAFGGGMGIAAGAIGGTAAGAADASLSIIFGAGDVVEAVDAGIIGGLSNFSRAEKSIPSPTNSFFIGTSIDFLTSEVITNALSLSIFSSAANVPEKYSASTS